MGFYATHVWDVEEHSVSWDELQCPIMHLIPTRNRMDFVWVFLRMRYFLRLYIRSDSINQVWHSRIVTIGAYIRCKSMILITRNFAHKTFSTSAE